jgi:hypothetical protein
MDLPLSCTPESSVPAEIHELTTLMRTHPGLTTGAGTSDGAALPFLINTCNMIDPKSFISRNRHFNDSLQHGSFNLEG